MARVYRKRQRKTDPVQELHEGQYNFEYILNPQGEQARLDEEMAREEQLATKKNGLLTEEHSDLDESLLPRHPEEHKVDHHTFMQVLITFVILALLIIGVLYFGR